MGELGVPKQRLGVVCQGEWAGYSVGDYSQTIHSLSYQQIPCGGTSAYDQNA